MSLDDITHLVRTTRGMAHKTDIAPVLARLNLGAATAIPVGDDCAAIPDGDGHLLLAIEGFLPDFCAADPHFAGYCGVMVNVSDIAAMGGRPIAVVDALWSADAETAAPLLEGMAKAAEKYRVPIVGGHTNTRAGMALLSVAILGRATRLLSSFAAQPGETLIAAIDLRGRLRGSQWWDCSTDNPANRLRGDLDILPDLADAELCAAAKDISMAGVVGTALMLLEASRLGAVIDLANIPRPPTFPLHHWLVVFPSYGFILSVPPEHADAVIGRFKKRGIAAAAIGATDASRIVRLRLEDETNVLWRFADEPLVGCVTEEPNHA